MMEEDRNVELVELLKVKRPGSFEETSTLGTCKLN